jgi:Undecaprenyl-phosphate glucose phosphotransferase
MLNLTELKYHHPQTQTPVAMPSQHNHQTVAASVVLPRHESFSRPPQPLWAAITKLLICEFCVVAGAAYLASVIYEAVIGELQSSHLYIIANLSLAAMVELIALGFGHYKNCQSQSRHAFLFSGFGAVALAFSFLLSALFLLKITELYSRATFVFQFITVEFAVLAARAFFYSRLQSSIAAGLVNARRVVLIGDAIERAEFANRLKATGIQTVGSFPFPVWRDDTTDDGDPQEYAEREVRRLIDGCRRLKADDILILAKQDSLAWLNGLVCSLSEVPAGLHVVMVEAATFLAAARIVEFGDTVTMQVLRPPLSQLQQAAKRVFDVVVAAAGLVILAPLLTLVAIAIKLDSPGPVLFRQTRHGYNNETIKVFKFRSMTKLEDGDAFVPAARNDSRVTRVGAILRRTNIDELPQLINVLRGEMSLVGPRPHATAHNKMFEGKISVYSRRHVVKPGITGWAQVNGCRGFTDLEQMRRRVEHDFYYIDNWSFWLDLRIIIMTLFSKSAYTNAY